MAQKQNIIDDVLKQMWLNKEKGESSLIKEIISYVPDATEEIISEIAEQGYITKKSGELVFIKKGEGAAAQLMRAHRLAERLFTDVLELEEKYMEENACSYEHILGPEIADAICTLLGHPGECPHGKKIPPGLCCKKELTEIKRLILPLSELRAGSDCKVIYITTVHHARLDQLLVMGISPGEVIRVHQTSPAFVIKAGETNIALDEEICRNIFVRQLGTR